ncbi:hypothetical protein J1N35_011565 [Gossypium stocksii]|uniref:Zinc knuckle CX2CX4HX4C domain-containing protein n=1 Tax=Gossypium stocksii TaxID=47602 RepID=A0A9D3W325_9ROSI|nr:hypothetical protein J1N35_011565 [Gossypium stocksii]
MAVFVDLGRPLISKILINGSPQRIEYENLPVVYFKCGCYRHISVNCSIITLPSESVEKGELIDKTTPSLVEAGEGENGPWMLVERRSKRGNTDESKKGNTFNRARNSGSRFHSLTDLDANLMEDDSKKESRRDLKKKGKITSEYQEVLSTDQVKANIPSSSHQQDQYFIHFNPTFEESSLVNVAIKDGVLDAKNHSTVVFKKSNNLDPIREEIGRNTGPADPNLPAKGCASDNFLRAFREYKNHYKPDLLEPRISGVKVDTIIAKLGWDKSHRVEAVGFSGGIWIGWKNFIDLERQLTHKLAKVQHALDLSGSKSLFQKEESIRKELENILYHEEMLWK